MSPVGITRWSSGLEGLDEVIKGVLPGDNIVWQVESIGDYARLAGPYCRRALKEGRKLVYFRFANHAFIPPPGVDIEIHELDPHAGFENFIADIHGVIETSGRGAFYVFDCLSDLATDWYSDQMLGNFFMLTCPFLFDMETVAYFALYRNFHSTHAIAPIQETTQLFLDVYRHRDDLYIHPLKVQQRHSPTMHMLHKWNADDSFTPVTSSCVIADVMGATEWSGFRSHTPVGSWDRAFVRGYEILDAVDRGGELSHEDGQCLERLVRMMISRDEKIIRLVSHYLDIGDLIRIQKRMIGTGLIGGKTVGMLLARAILTHELPRFEAMQETHDSFYVGSDVFYTFLVCNGIWWVRQKQRNPESFLDGSEQARRRILTGTFPDYLVKQLEEMLDYFGQSPFIVRSSSLLEDNYGNSFAGKYDSVFCTNQGPRHRRLEDLLAAIRTIYASSMSEEALQYRAQRNLLQHDEQMALLIMRVSGAMYGKYYLPQVAGVGFSYNPYAWSEHIDPNAGVLRLVFGLGTRAVDRSDDDYTRIVALNDATRRPESNFDEIRQYTQRRVDYLDLDANQLVSGDFVDLAENAPGLPLAMLARQDSTRNRERSRLPAVPPWRIHFDRLLAKTDFVETMREMLQCLQTAYQYPVDIEFTMNMVDDSSYKINLVQCRPLQVQGTATSRLPEFDRADKPRIIDARGAVIGQSRMVRIGRMIYVVPEVYSALSVRERYEAARMLGRINRACQGMREAVMLLGPGRWGTSTPALGVPVSFADIHHVSILVEIVTMHENLIPDVSLGTHFLNELIEMDMLYLALFPNEQDNYLNHEFFMSMPNRFSQLVPDADGWERCLRVMDSEDLPDPPAVTLAADAPGQQVFCYQGLPPPGTG